MLSQSQRPGRPPFRAATLAIAGVALSGCLSQGPPLALHRQTDDDAGKSPSLVAEVPTSDGGLDLPPADPHAVIGVDPSHGPFRGGQARLVRGNGFGKGLRVWFGPNEVPQGDVIAIDPVRAQVVVPPGKAGPVDVKAQIGDDASTARTLSGGYVYEPFYAEPASGPTSGGTEIHVYGDSTSWSAGTTVSIDGKPCQTVKIVSAGELTCRTPPGSPGSKSVEVSAEGGVFAVRDAFTYSNSDNGFRGGLSGDTLAGHLQVLVFDSFTGDPIPSAYVLAGDDDLVGPSKMSDANGLAVFDDPALVAPRSVTIAARCHHPITFVDVPVAAVTAYLDPVLSPSCASGGDLPSVAGGHPVLLATIEGELVWGEIGEFRSAAWRNVPSPIGPSEKVAAYVFGLSDQPTSDFSLPSSSSAVLPSDQGAVGFSFRFDTIQGNLTLYALAGLENRSVSPPKFTPYAMGVVRGVPALPGQVTHDVYIPMDIALDHTVTMSAMTPASGPRGPDRGSFSVAVEVDHLSYAIFPQSTRTSILPAPNTISFVGLPALAGPLTGSRYVVNAIAATGPLLTAPLSDVGQFAGTVENITLPAFVPVPSLTAPAPSSPWDRRHLTVSFGAPTTAVDLTVLKIDSGGELLTWTVAAPGGSRTFTLPDLGRAFLAGALLPGSVSINVYGARLNGFDYRQLRYRQLSIGGFDAYSLDTFPVRTE